MELLVWVVDKGNLATEPASGYGSYFSGDFIAYKPDGWSWTDAERNENRWRILRVPLSAAQQALVNNLCASSETQRKTGYIWKRAWRLDVSLLPPAIRPLMVGPTNGQIIDVTVPQLQAAVTQKALR